MHRGTTVWSACFPPHKSASEDSRGALFRSRKVREVRRRPPQMVEQRRIMRQAEKYNQQTWQQEKQPAHQLILPMEPSHEDEDQITFDRFITPPESEPQRSNDKQPSSGT